MRKIISLTLASLMLLSAVSCAKTAESVKVSSSASAAETLIAERLGSVPDDVIIGDSAVAASYGVDMTDFDSEGFVVRTVGDKTLVFGKTEDGLDMAARYYVNNVYGNPSPVDKVYGEGARIDSFTVCGRPLADFVITVTAEHPEGSYPESTAFASEELSLLIEQATGVTVPVVDDAGDRPYINLTCDGSGDNGEEGFAITVADDGNIEILGGQKRGCLYAVYDIAEKWLGMRFVAHDYTYIYEKDMVNITPEDSYSDAPLMTLRQPQSATVNKGLPGFSQDPLFSGRNKIHATTNTAKYGFSPLGTTHHGLYRFWGTGSADPNLCFLDEEVTDMVIGNIEAELEAAKESGALYKGNHYQISIGQNDNPDFCWCEKCIEVFREEGAYSGTIVRQAKIIGDYFAEDYPQVMFFIFGYMGTEKPPKITKLPDNVSVSYCIIGACYCGHLDGSDCRPDRVAFSGYTAAGERENLLGWKEVAKRVDVRLYYFSDSLGQIKNVIPFLRDDMEYMYSLGIKDLYVEIEEMTFAYDYPATWLMSKLMWNPLMSEEEYDALVREIMRIWYGDGYTYILDQLEIYDRFFVCADNTTWNAVLDYNRIATDSEVVLELFEYAARYADSQRTANNVRLISAHAKYNAYCAWYEDKFVNGTEEERAYMISLRDDLRETIEWSGVTYVDFWERAPVAKIKWDGDPKTWTGKM